MKTDKTKKQEYQTCSCGLFWPIDINKVKPTNDGMHYYIVCPRCKCNSYIDFNKRPYDFREQVFRKSRKRFFGRFFGKRG